MPLYFHNIELLIPVFMKKLILLSTTLFLTSLFALAQVSKNGLLAVYKFDGDYKDSTSNKRHALWANTTLVADRNSTANSAVSFNGDDGFVTSYIGSPTDITIAYWCKPETQTDPYPHMFDYGDYKFRAMIMAGSIYGPSDKNKIYFGTNYPNEVFTKSASTINYNQWQHMAFVFDKTNNKIKVYVDGLFSNESTISSTLTPADSIIIFGRIKSGPSSEINTSNYKGAIDDIYIYGRALSAQEVADLKDGNFSSLGVPNFGDNNTPEEAFIYPNPTEDGFTVEMKNDAIKILSIKLFDLTGKLISVTYESNVVNTTNLAAGTYLVQIAGKNDTVIATERIVVK